MINEIRTLVNNELGKVRIVYNNNEYWWVLSDVCKILELTNPSKVAKRLDDDERSNFKLGRQGNTIIINESGLYNVILRSDKPQAKIFRKWVTHEVLPAIRKSGKYEIDTLETFNQHILATINNISSENQQLHAELDNISHQMQRMESLVKTLMPAPRYTNWKSKMGKQIKQLSKELYDSDDFEDTKKDLLVMSRTPVTLVMG